MSDSTTGISRLDYATDSDEEEDVDTPEHDGQESNSQEGIASTRVTDWSLIGPEGLSGLLYKVKSLLGYGQEQPVGRNRKAPKGAKEHQRKIYELRDDDELSVNIQSPTTFGYEVLDKIAVPIVEDGKFAGIMKDGKPTLGIHALFFETPFGGHAFWVQGFERRSKAYPKLMRGDILLDAFLVEDDVQAPNPGDFLPLHRPGQITNLKHLLAVSARLGQQIERLVEYAKRRADKKEVTNASILFDVARPKAGSGKALTLRTFSNFGEGRMECSSSF